VEEEQERKISEKEYRARLEKIRLAKQEEIIKQLQRDRLAAGHDCMQDLLNLIAGLRYPYFKWECVRIA